jgi:hypothetical protein
MGYRLGVVIYGLHATAYEIGLVSEAGAAGIAQKTPRHQRECFGASRILRKS